MSAVRRHSSGVALTGMVVRLFRTLPTVLFGRLDMKSVRIGHFGLAGVILSMTVAGCSFDSSGVDTLPRVAVTGTVTIDGKPLPEGRLQFEPDPSSSGIMTPSARSRTGNSRSPRGAGPIPGKYRVMISSNPAYKLKPGQEPGGGPPPAGPEKVPKQFTGKKTELVVDVSANGPNSYEFDLKSKK